jgi:predicted DNA-binding transcriptional regulator YafY
VSKYERLARLLKIITLVKANPRLNRTDLARLCEVNSVRTIQRDINTLAIAQVPIYWSGEGYEIMPGYFLPPLALNLEEALSLILSVKAYRAREGKFHESTVESAISKIVATLPKTTKYLIEEDSDKIDIENQKTNDASGLLNPLYQAIFDKKQLHIVYYSYSSNQTSERIIEPYALTFRGRAWYLIAFCHKKSQILMFRINRIKKIQNTGKTFEYPPDFSLKDYMAKSWNVMNGEDTKVVVKFSPKVAPLIKEIIWHSTQQIEDKPDGSILYTAIVAGTKEISFWILSYGNDAEVILPESLRNELASVAKKMCQIYQ